MNLILNKRAGRRPETTPNNPHMQLEHHGSEELIDKLFTWSFLLPHVEEKPSGISVPRSRALTLSNEVQGNPNAFMVGREFAHIHPAPDLGSLHLKLSPIDANTLVESGWGEHHPVVLKGYQAAGAVMVYSPRDEEELEQVKTIILQSYHFATFNNLSQQ